MFATDLDDTLFREMEYVRSGYRAIGAELERNGVMSQKEAIEIIESAATTAQGFDNLAAQIWLRYPDSPYNAKWMVELYRTHKPDIRLLPGVRTALEYIRDAGHEIAIITDGRSNTQRTKIEALGLDRYVAPSNIIISSEIGADKTTKLPFETLMARNKDERQFLYIGDNPAKDFHWPNTMGWTTVEVLDVDGVHVHPQDIDVPEEYRARHLVRRFADVLNLLSSM